MPVNKIKKQLRKYITFNPANWLRSMRRLETMVGEWMATGAEQSPATEGKSMAILVTPWLGTVVPWYSILVGLLLAARGSTVVFVFDDLPFGKAPHRSAFIRGCIRRVLRLVRPRHQVLVLSDYLEGGGGKLDGGELIERMAALNAVHALRGEMIPDGRDDYIALVRGQLHVADPAIQRLLARNSFDAIFIPGGIYGTSGLWLDRATKARIRVASYDAGGYGTVLLATDGIAAQLQDVPRAFCKLKADGVSPYEHEFIIQSARTEIEKRHQGKDVFISQMVATSATPLDKYRGAILVALNSSWDQAALGLHTVFGTNANWIRETVQWVIDHTDFTIVLRQHPSERLEVASTTDNYGAFLKEHFGNHERVLFISAHEPINSYELLSVVSTVVAYTSTIGVEAAALGKRVIVPSSSYYAGLGFVWSAASREEYFDLLRRAQLQDLDLTDAMRQDATYCYYVTQICNWVFSPFSPESYTLWSKESVASLNADPTVEVLLSALASNTPAALLNHANNLAAAPVGRVAA